ncbi:MAG: response regulator [Chloroflexi bacterium]|jgi:NarL family two-component system response regulator LiaR|nr:response regulator [Chloroflexota bacterium]
MTTHPPPSHSIRVLIADDHAVVREGLRTLINTEPGMAVIGEASDGREAIQQCLSLQPDVILLDMVMPHKSGLEVIDEVRRENPHARILVLTSFASDDVVFPAIKSGALGYLLKNSSPQRLLHAIRDVYRGEPSMSPAIAKKLMLEMQRPSELPPTEDPLTTREVEVLRLLAQGLTNQEIAAQLVIGEGTVRTHVSNILSKLHLANRTQAALYALREGLVSLDS